MPEIIVPAGHGRACEARAGQYITIEDRHDPREFLSPHNTRLAANALVPPVGARFVTSRRRPMFVLCVRSACPMDLNARNGGSITDLRVRVHNEADWL